MSMKVRVACSGVLLMSIAMATSIAAAEFDARSASNKFDTVAVAQPNGPSRPLFYNGKTGSHYLHVGTTGEALYKVKLSGSDYAYHERLTLIEETKSDWRYKEIEFPNWVWTIAKHPTYRCVSYGRFCRRTRTVYWGYKITLHVNDRQKLSYYANRTKLGSRSAEEARSLKAGG